MDEDEDRDEEEDDDPIIKFQNLQTV